ncbi:hypothetical protein BVC80_9101g304 [Macleaya cordata]|uniref:Uncharacterized protein n=1 Tax=Macleaya cordata TaxID=56857 RepID=A0A200QGZ8_MACCD|nr:hypothetical protein BVC80_9101g304 [Macleaya cordata]
MGNKDQSSTSRVPIRALSFFLLLLTLLYAAFFRSNPLDLWTNQIMNWSTSGGGGGGGSSSSYNDTKSIIEEEGDPIGFLVRRLVRDITSKTVAPREASDYVPLLGLRQLGYTSSTNTPWNWRRRELHGIHMTIKKI